ncbi:MAG: hypothetical protein R3C58_08565 [Parvularculaceae bacterium]
MHISYLMEENTMTMQALVGAAPVSVITTFSKKQLPLPPVDGRRGDPAYLGFAKIHRRLEDEYGVRGSRIGARRRACADGSGRLRHNRPPRLSEKTGSRKSRAVSSIAKLRSTTSGARCRTPKNPKATRKNARRK